MDHEATKEQERWESLLSSLDIVSCDEYEFVVAKYLRSGLLDRSEVDPILDRYVNETDQYLAQQKTDEFFKQDLWHWEKTEDQLVEEAESLVPHVHFLDPFRVTTLFDTVGEYANGKDVANKIIAWWIAHFNAHPPKDIDEGIQDDPFGRKIHPDIEAAFEALRDKLYPLPSLYEVAEKRHRDQGRGARDREVMKRSTPELFITTIRGLTGEKLKIFLKENIDLYANKRMYEDEFGGAMDNFVQACRGICLEDPSSRLTRVIKLAFNSKTLQDHLQELQHEHDQT